MELSSKNILNILKANNVQSLFHANTVQTACGFLSQGLLLSRGRQSEMGLSISSQMTDSIDKQHGIWYDLFVDTVNIHAKFNCRNNYGPVLFELDIDILNKETLPYVWITKSNPSNWNKNTKFEDKYFSSIEDFEANFKLGDVDKLFLFRNIGGSIKLKDFLKKITIDSGGSTKDRKLIRLQSIEALKNAALAGGLDTPEIAIHNCGFGCNCDEKYSPPYMKDTTYRKFFSPSGV